MRATVHVIKSGKEIVPHFTVGEHVYKPNPEVEVLFSISGEDDSENLLQKLAQEALTEARRRNLEVNPRDFFSK